MVPELAYFWPSLPIIFVAFNLYLRSLFSVHVLPFKLINLSVPMTKIYWNSLLQNISSAKICNPIQNLILCITSGSLMMETFSQEMRNYYYFYFKGFWSTVKDPKASDPWRLDKMPSIELEDWLKLLFAVLHPLWPSFGLTLLKKYT